MKITGKRLLTDVGEVNDLLARIKEVLISMGVDHLFELEVMSDSFSFYMLEDPFQAWAYWGNVSKAIGLVDHRDGNAYPFKKGLTLEEKVQEHVRRTIDPVILLGVIK